MKTIVSAITVLIVIVTALVCLAAPSLTIPTTTNVGAGSTTLVLQSSSTGKGYFTLNAGNSANCGDGAKVAFGPYSTGSFHGSLSLTANAPGNYTVRNLKQNTSYTVCFTADSPGGSNLNQNPVFSNISTNSTKAFNSPGWSSVGNTGFSAGSTKYTSLAIAPDGTPYVAYQDGGNSNRVTVKKLNGSGWILVGNAGFSAGEGDFVSLVFSPDGTPYVACQDYVPFKKAMVWKHNQALNIWEEVGSAGVSTGQADYVSLAFANDGTPYLAFVDYANFGITVTKFTGSTWEDLARTGLPSDAAFLSLAFSPGGTPHLAYADYDGSGKATVKKYNGSEWLAVGSSEFSASSVNYPSLAFSPDGISYIAYRDDGNSSKATVMKYGANGWEPVGYTGLSTGGADFTSLSFAPDGNPCVAYQDWANGNKATVMKFNGSTWSSVSNAGFSAGRADYTALAFSPDGTPHVAFVDSSTGLRATVMRLNNFPTISGFPPATVPSNTLYSFTPTVNEYTTGFTIENKPSWASFDTATGNLSGTPTTAGTYGNIVITANNEYGSAALPAFSIAVDGISVQSGSVKIGATFYSNINEALLAASISGGTLEILGDIIPEGVNYSGSGIITLEGGYDAGWTRQSGLLAPVSSLTITSGTLVIDQIVVK